MPLKLFHEIQREGMQPSITLITISGKDASKKGKVTG
jgi:hypothetical protein